MPPDPTVRKSSSRVLVTGATGFLGRAVAEALDRAGHDVLRGARIAPAAAPAGERWIGYGDVGPATRWDEALAGVDTVVHLAGLAHLPDAAAATAADTFARVNAEGTARLASAAVGAGVRRLVLVSSALVHGEASPGRPFTEDDAPAPASPYARSKLDSERRLMAAARGSALQWVILRPPMVYGAGAGGNFRRLVGLVRTGAAAAARRRHRAQDLHRHRQPGRRRGALRRARRAPPTRSSSLGDAETTSTADLIHRIAGALGRRVWTPRVSPALLRTAFRLAGRERDFRRLFDPLELDTSRIRTLLDWSPPVSLDEGLRRAVRELRE